jgi:hypothetical protein
MRISRRRHIWLTGTVGAALVAVGLAPGSAAPSENERFHRFAGSCSLKGTSTFNPPLTNTQQRLSFNAILRGTCSGRLDGRRVSNARVRMHNTGRADASCLQSRTTRPGQGAMTFADGRTIRYTFGFTFVLTEGDLTVRGRRSGSARGHISFATDRTPPDAAAKCAGEGNAKLPLDVTLTTDSPLVG